MTTSEGQERQDIRLVSIVAIDVAGFSTMTERDQRRAAKQIEKLRARIETVATANQGRVFNTAGDGFMLEFGAAGAALGAIQELLDKRPRGEPAIRIGAHVGDVIVTAGADLLGHGVNVAARLQGLASPNSALVSGEFRSMARTSPQAVFQSRGRQPLENIDQRVQTFAILSSKARQSRFLSRVGAGMVAIAVGAGLVFVVPPTLDLLERQQFLRPQAVAASSAPVAPKAATPTQSSAVQSAPAQEAAQALAHGGAFRDCDQCPEMVVITGGAFRMGSLPGEIGHFATEAPLHDVTVPGFAIGKYEVTFAEWDACAAAGGCNRRFPSDRSWGRGRRPVVGVSWRDVQGYVRWLNEKTDGPDYRLPSEAEWEYAARAGSATRYAFGDRIDRTQALFRARQTDPVGTYAANAFGLFDMHGNAAEWVGDCYNATYLGLPADGRAAATGTCAMRPYRGGAWRDDANALRAANRRRANANLRDSTIGFRVARNLN